jgi:hypothetical protein
LAGFSVEPSNSIPLLEVHPPPLHCPAIMARAKPPANQRRSRNEPLLGRARPRMENDPRDAAAAASAGGGGNRPRGPTRTSIIDMWLYLVVDRYHNNSFH